MHAPPPEPRASIQAYVLGSFGLLAAGVLLAVSAAMNFKFGYQLGRTEADGLIYGGASVAADCFKALAPFFFFAAVRNRMWSQAMAAALVWLVTTGYALTGAVGHASLNRSEVASKREAISDTVADLRKERARIEQQIAWIPQHRPASTVAAEIEAKKTDRLFRSTGSCTAVTSAAGRTFCADLHRLDAELGSAVEGAKLQARLDDIATKLAPIGATGTAAADPQAQTFSRLTGYDLALVQSLLALFVVVLIEVCSGLGPYVAMSYFPDRPRRVRRAPDATTETAEATRETETVITAANENDRIIQFPSKVETLEAVAPVETGTVTSETGAVDVADDAEDVGPAPQDAVAAMVPQPTFSQWPARKDEAEPDLRRLLAATGGQIPSQKFLRERWGTAKGTISKWLNSWSWVELRWNGTTTVVTEAQSSIAA